MPTRDEEAVIIDNKEESSDYDERLANVAASVVESLDVDHWVAIIYDGEWYPGSVQEVRCIHWRIHFIYFGVYFLGCKVTLLASELLIFQKLHYISDLMP